MANKIFNPISVSDQAFLLASHLPKGKYWEKAFDIEDDFGKLFYALAFEFYRFQVLEQKLLTEFDINKTTELISEWEKSVGIPDSCFDNDIGLEKRRKQVYAKFSKFGGIQKKEDFIRIALFFEINISITTGRSVGTFPLAFPTLFFSTNKSASHTFFVKILDNLTETKTFPLKFPISFSVGVKDFLQCLFNFLAPANINILVINKGDI